MMLAHFLVLGALIQGVSSAEPSWSFTTDPVGKLPNSWETRGDSAKPVYQIKVDPDGNRYLSAQSLGTDVQLGVEVKVDPKDMPILSWRWRVSQLPTGADERRSKTLDSAAAVYAVFGSRLFPRILKYVWSTSVGVGSSFEHPSSSRMVIIVINSGNESLQQWQQVRRDLITDYRAAFGASPPNLIGIGVKTDSDSTRTSAQADYDDIRFMRR